MKVFLTGGTGLLGANLARELLKRGCGVKTLVRPSSDVSTLEGLELSFHEGDLLTSDALLSGMEGCTYVIHAAANTDVWPTYSQAQWDANVKGTQNMIQAALKTGVSRFIHVSTANVFGFGSLVKPGNEQSPFLSGKYKLGYIDSKYAAQQRVEQAIKELGLPAIMINPTFMIGPYDSKPSSGAMVKGIMEEGLPGYPAGGKNFVAVKDVATATVNALQMGSIGESYILGNENLSFRQAFQLMANVAGVKPPSIPLPPLATKLYGRIGSILGSVSGQAPKVSYPTARIACDGHYFDPSKARKEIGLTPTPISTAIQEAVQWFRRRE
ncbi:MAG: NAD-dependent epimerase/dehydratase family protein [Bacteroidota bacterium]